MKSLSIGCALAVLAVGGSAWSQAAPGVTAAEQAVAALEHQWLQSQRTNNPELLAPLLAEKFVDTTAEGKVLNRAQALANARARRYTSVEYENVQVTVSGDTAIATGVYRGRGTEGGKPFAEHERWTDTWVK
ncbi:MAG TPA: nuclear transport factor 2 family protein, partial [Steroidobacteraceae bacterium]|nr:nuclear transport factor 2 family protein [Steroidobacteraceae bacterium]